ncbi:MAG TPA: alpha/beta hydrolase [Kofleriaceae bacterium]|nr:alpha/beta hydrolase [Kofleriaceae bacterium]
MIEAVSEAVAGEARAFNAKLEALLATQPSVHTLPAELVRAARREGKGIFPPPVFLPEATWVDANGVRLRVVRPPGPARGVYLHIHGGGWTLGGADMQDGSLRELARATGLVAASVDYRLAPEHPFPAGADDCEIAARWLLAGGARELDAPARFAIGGESAGAHLAALVLLRVRGGFYAANLVYGAYDLGMTPSQRNWGERNLVLSGPIIEYFGNAFLPNTTLEQRRAPQISPLYAELGALPPALFTVGTLDPLLDDTLFMAARWQTAGNAATLRVWPHAVHGFNAFDLELARISDRDQFEFLSRSLPT